MPKYSVYIALIPMVQNQPEPRTTQGPGRSRQEAENESANFKAPAAGDFALIITHQSAGASAISTLVNLGSFHPKWQVLLEDLLFIEQLASSQVG